MWQLVLLLVASSRPGCCGLTVIVSFVGFIVVTRCPSPRCPLSGRVPVWFKCDPVWWVGLFTGVSFCGCPMSWSACGWGPAVSLDILIAVNRILYCWTVPMLSSLALLFALRNFIVAPLRSLYICPGVSVSFLSVTLSVFVVKGHLYVFFSNCRSAMSLVSLVVAFSRSSSMSCLLSPFFCCEVPIFR